MKIAIVGAGFAGLSSAKVLIQFGHEVTVYEKAPDVGGVWSSTRNYPGLTTQNVRDTYCLSDLKMPKSYPEYPKSAQVQAYLEAYAEKFELAPFLNLSTEVVAADQDKSSGKWSVTSRAADGAETTDKFDQLVVASGIFSDPFIPDFPGKEAYQKAGGVVKSVSDVRSLDEIRDKHVALVGFGKSTCDMAVSANEVSASTTVVARHLLWKLPKMVGKVVPYKMLFLTRMGEALIGYQFLRGFEWFLHTIGRPMRWMMLSSVESAVKWQLKLKKNSLHPGGHFEDIARSTVSLASDGFFEAVDKGTIKVKRESEVARLLEDNGELKAELTSGETIKADIVICGTGWKQSVPFLKPEVEQQLLNERGEFELYQYIHPFTIKNLFFVGYNSSFFSPLSAETAAMWVAAYLDGMITLPPEQERRKKVAARLEWMRERTRGKHARGTNLIPFSMHNIDETLDEIGVNVGLFTRFNQWLLPPVPGHYQKCTKRLLKKQARHKQATSKRTA